MASAATFIASVIRRARASSAPRKMPGNAHVGDALQGVPGDDGDLAALVPLQDLVNDLHELDPLQRADGLDHPLEMRVVIHIDRNVSSVSDQAEADRFHLADVSPGLTDRRAQPPQVFWLILDEDSQRFDQLVGILLDVHGSTASR
jgi:hypothetical protein